MGRETQLLGDSSRNLHASQIDCTCAVKVAKRTLSNVLQHTLGYGLVQRGVRGVHCSLCTQPDTHYVPHTKATSDRSGHRNVSELQSSSLKNLYSPQPLEDDCCSRAFSTEMQPMAEARSQPKGGCRTWGWQDSYNKLALTEKIKLWRNKWSL